VAKTTKKSGWKIFMCVCTESGVSSRQNDTLLAGFDGKLNVLQGDEKNKSNSVRCEVGSLSLICNIRGIFFLSRFWTGPIIGFDALNSSFTVFWGCVKSLCLGRAGCCVDIFVSISGKIHSQIVLFVYLKLIIPFQTVSKTMKRQQPYIGSWCIELYTV
jgi:hypothetical protein